MKIKYIIILIAIIFLSFIGFQTFSFSTEGRSHYFKNTDSIDLSNESFAKVKLHDNIDDSTFIARYGKPVEKEDNEMYDYYHWENGLQTASVIKGQQKGKIVRLIIGEVEKKNSSKLKTAKGITIGSTKKDIISLYGPHYYKRVEQGTDIIGYVDQKLHVTLEFWLVEGGKVAEIRLDDSDVQ
ncbi:hypothetical protein IHQ11_26645 [Priestia megaterium]|uniref:hypothetical protein n=1 Tax=Priestia megaterium TaxID=1404 RepID=UPI001B3A03EE|nr:hypothetical protein [Priestia megaterium]MBQ4870031.1 hypothetical protein [Priestia megaterium]